MHSHLRGGSLPRPTQAGHDSPRGSMWCALGETPARHGFLYSRFNGICAHVRTIMRRPDLTLPDIARRGRRALWSSGSCPFHRRQANRCSGAATTPLPSRERRPPRAFRGMGRRENARLRRISEVGCATTLGVAVPHQGTDLVYGSACSRHRAAQQSSVLQISRITLVA